jgi:hypothetical protein
LPDGFEYVRRWWIRILIRIELDRLARLRLLAWRVWGHGSHVAAEEFLKGFCRHLARISICAEEALAQEYDTYGCST